MTRSVSSSTAEMLQPIWARLLEGPSITAEDNFFARGGNPAIAVELFEEIAKITADGNLSSAHRRFIGCFIGTV